jgi:hypothetical protein
MSNHLTKTNKPNYNNNKKLNTQNDQQIEVHNL